MTNDGNWKKVTRRKKFKLDYGNEEEAFNDHFHIGISIVHSGKT